MSQAPDMTPASSAFAPLSSGVTDAKGTTYPTRAQGYADAISTAAQAAAAISAQASAAGGKNWYQSKTVLGAALSAFGSAVAPSIFIASHASPATAATWSMAITLGGALFSLIGRATATQPLK